MSWKLYDKVTIVAKPVEVYDYKQHKIVYQGYEQGYVVEYGNKKMLDSAITWAVGYQKDKTPEQFDFDNNGFLLTIHNSAGGSSQGGKLSFMSCWIEKDGHKFLIGINSELLVELIKNTTIINGVCQSEVCFARKDGQVGVLTKDMDSYKEAVEYENRSTELNKKKTTKWIIGHVYETVSTKVIYLGKLYQWYDMERVDSDRKMWKSGRINLILRKTPKVKYLVCHIEKSRWTGKEDRWYELLDKLPSKTDSGVVKTEEECKEEINSYLDTIDKELIDYFDEHRSWYYYEKIGLSCSENSPKLYDDEMKKRFETQRYYFCENSV